MRLFLSITLLVVSGVVWARTSDLVPFLVASVAFLGAGILLASTALPADGDRP